jgi:hypothetical protein
MPEAFQYDVFLSHSAKDKAVMRPLAERLRKDELKVWFDEWALKLGDMMLVIRTVDGEIRWMDVSAYLKLESAGGKTVRQIVFKGERFDAVSVQNWRKKVLAGG